MRVVDPYIHMNQVLKTPHPVTGEYSQDDDQAAEEMNAMNITKERTNATGIYLANVTDKDEYNALSHEDKSRWLTLCCIPGTFDITDGVARAELDALFPSGQTRNRVTAVATELNTSVSIEEGFGNRVKGKDVAYARSLDSREPGPQWADGGKKRVR